MRYLLFLFFLFAFLLFANQKVCGTGTTLRGKVIDSLDNKPIVGVSILCVNGDFEGTYTNIDGYFNLVSQKGNIFMISYLGYETVYFICDSNTICDTVIRISPTHNLLTPIVISGEKSAQKLTEVTVSMESIKPYLAQNKNIFKPQNLSDQIPGVNVIDRQVNIRSGSGWSYGAGSRVTVLLDGMPMMSGDAGQVLWSFLPLENLANTEVIKGASSVLYGSSALNGIIHFQSQRPNTIAKYGLISFVGFYQIPKSLQWSDNHRAIQMGLMGFYSQKIKKTEISILSNLIDDNGFRMGENDKRNTFGFNVLHHVNKKLSIGARSNILKSNSGSFLLWHSLDSGYTAFNHQTTITKATNFHFDPYLTYKHKHTTHSFKLRYLYINNQLDNGNPDVDQSNSSDFVWSEYLYQRDFNKINLKLSSGLVASYTQSRSPLFSGNQEAQNLAAFFQVDKRIGKLKISAGARWEQYTLNQIIENKPVFRTGINYQVAKFSFLRSSWGQGYRFPTIAEAFINTSAGPVNVYPNPELQSETGWNFEIGFKQGWKIRKVSGFLDVAVFRMEYQNMMEFIFGQWNKPTSTDPLGIGFKSVNVGKSRVDGIEMSLNGEGVISKNGKIIFLGGLLIANPISLDTNRVFGKSQYGDSFTYYNTSSNPENSILKYRSRYQVKLDVQYEYKKVDIGVSYRFNSRIENIDKAFVSLPLSFFVSGIEEGRNTSKKGINYIDVRLGYKFNNRVKASLIINNITNRIYMLRPADLQSPRLFLLQVRYRV